jgi:hypothetical protein
LAVLRAPELFDSTPDPVFHLDAIPAMKLALDPPLLFPKKKIKML